MLQIEYSLANSHQSLSASNFIILCNVSVSRDLLRAIIHTMCFPELYDCPKKVSRCVFQNCMIARRRSLETETLQSIMKFDGPQGSYPEVLRVAIRNREVLFVLIMSD